MRWLFLLLLFANAGLWMWGSWYREIVSLEGRTPRPELRAQELRLLSAPTVETLPAQPGAESEATLGCRSIGPFMTAEALAAGRERLRRLGVAATERTERVRVPSAHRVFLAPLSNTRAAERRRQELAGLGLTDLAVIAQGPRKNGISLGVFSDADKAQRRLHEVAVKGVEAQVETLYRRAPHYWLDTTALAPAVMAEIEAAFADDGIAVQKGVCRPAGDGAAGGKA